jgi:hypothetical protein
MLKLMVALAAPLAVALSANVALAQTPGAPTTQPGILVAPAPAPPPAAIDFSIAPRFWYLFSSGGFPKPASSLSLTSNPQFELPMAGATVSARPAALPDTTFLLTFLYGQSTVDADSLCVLAQCNSATPVNALNSMESLHDNRYDTELLVQTGIPNTPAAWIIGGRWEHEDLHGSATFTTVPTVGAPSVTTAPESSWSNFISIKGGLTGAEPISADGNLRFFGNIMVLGGIANTADGNWGLVGPDVSVGIQYAFSSSIVADLRYRAVVDFFLGAPAGSAKYGITQGPMIGVNFKF